MMEPTRRFDDRASEYGEYRPGYPDSVFRFMEKELGLNSRSRVADIAAGTGILAEYFLKNGNPVACVEPNLDMLAKAKEFLASYPRSTIVAATAEKTGLQAKSFDYVVAGQAFHWFKIKEARNEFARILAPGGWVILLWNTRERSSLGAVRDYEELLLRFSADYRTLRTPSNEERAAQFFDGKYGYRRFENLMHWDFERLSGYLFSCSYMPRRGTPEAGGIIPELGKVFDRYQQNGKLGLPFATELFYGQM